MGGQQQSRPATPPPTYSSTQRKKGKSKSYEEIKKKCKKSKKLWEDPDFPADGSSFYFDGRSDGIEWKRPQEICDNPEMFVDGASRFDVQQGDLGNCWLLAAVASVTTDEKLLYQVVPRDQNFKKDYMGMFRFQFWQYGSWVEVWVDDRLPTKNGMLVCMHSVSQNEFWSPLLEKAYAKINGCYEGLSGGWTIEALEDLTGGLGERYNFREEMPDNVFRIMSQAKKRGALMGCSIDADAGNMEQELDNGLITGHSYSITDVRKVPTKKGEAELVRVRNPWGNEAEWSGAWGDRSAEWKMIDKKTREMLGITFEHDGEFWMSCKDFVTHFQRLGICNLVSSGSKVWQTSIKHGSWTRKVNAGGRRNNQSYFSNPQYQIKATDTDEDDDEDVCTLIIALMQKDRRQLKQRDRYLRIGFDLYQLDKKSGKQLDKKFFHTHKPVATSKYINYREVTGRYRVTPGEYCIVPTTFAPDEEAEFMIRVFGENAYFSTK